VRKRERRTPRDSPSAGSSTERAGAALSLNASREKRANQRGRCDRSNIESSVSEIRRLDDRDAVAPNRWMRSPMQEDASKGDDVTIDARVCACVHAHTRLRDCR